MKSIGKQFFYISYLLLLLQGSILYAQDPKPPIAETDYASTFITTPVTINVLANDYSYEGNNLVIYAITNVSSGDAYFEDSLIYYTPSNSSSTIQFVTVNYMIKDMITGLWSDPGDVIIQLERPKNRIFSPNGLGVRINALGNQFMAVDSFNYTGPTHHFEAPVNGGRHPIYNSTLWLAGLDEGGNIHTACERYRKGKLPYMTHRGWDFWVGPVMNEENYTTEYLHEHNKLWYITREDISHHTNNYQEPGYIVPKRIKNWPANGFPELGTADILAPFVDRNNNGFYDPANGDYPLFQGDEAIYFIFNDDYGEHTESFGRKLGIEVQGLAYGFNCAEDSAFNNTIFIRYTAINRSDTTYHDVYLGNYTNFVIGGHDDYIACDSVLDAFYAYNMDDFDDSVSVMYPAYLSHPPAQAVMNLNQPIDHFMGFHFPWPYSDTIFNLAPTSADRYYNYMKSVWNDSTHLTYGGDGHLGNVEVNRAFTGDPLSGSGWLEENSGMDNLVLQGIASHGPLEFKPGDSLVLELAYVFARDYLGDHLSSVALLKERMEKVKWYYENDSTPCSSPWTFLEKYEQKNRGLYIRPNPASEYILIDELALSNSAEYEIFRITGEIVKKGIFSGDKKVNISALTNGLYFIRIHNLDDVLTTKFIKN